LDVRQQRVCIAMVRVGMRALKAACIAAEHAHHWPTLVKQWLHTIVVPSLQEH